MLPEVIYCIAEVCLCLACLVYLVYLVCMDNAVSLGDVSLRSASCIVTSQFGLRALFRGQFS